MKRETFIVSTVTLAFVIFALGLIGIVYAGENDPSTFGNSTAVTASLGGSTGNLTMSGSARIATNLTIVGTTHLLTFPAQCPANNSFVTKFTGNGSTCTQVNESAFSFIGNCAAGSVVQNITASGIQCVTDATGTASSGSIRFVARKTIDGTTEQCFGLNTSVDFWQFYFNLHKNTTGVASETSIRINDTAGTQSTSGYKFQGIHYSTAENANEDAWRLSRTTTGTELSVGVMTLSRVQNFGGNVALTGSVAYGDVGMMWGGRNQLSSNVTGFCIKDYTGNGARINGTIDIYDVLRT